MIQPGSFPFVHTLRVRYSEIDGQKVVFNSHYLTYIDVAITEYFRNLGAGALDSPAFEIALVKATLEFKRSARLDDLLDVHVSVPKLGNSSFTGRFRISPANDAGEQEPYLEAEIIYVSYSQETGGAAPIPDWIRDRVESFQNPT
ncbi:acyl-CoA thioesterase [Rubrobacter aplysinae]|uniref:acyl-CoA thioesterase n=1 Tax=Rubrobacter aplysinae TaxID=909625 RepID=UPI00064C249F|nr:thioesterase family protein [Rubrobacter aplysinae]